MSFQPAARERKVLESPAWSGLAIVVEAMVLMVFLVTSIAVLTQLFAASAVRAREGRELATAVSYATNTAERFAAEPASAAGSAQEGDLVVTCEVEEVPNGAGTLYEATITVTRKGSDEPIYVLNTSRYEREVG